MDSFNLSASGITVSRILRNAAPARLYEEALRYEPDTAIASTGALVALSGKKTGRSPKDKRIVENAASSNDIWWGSVNVKLPDTTFVINRERAVDYLNTRKQSGVALSTFQALRHRMADVKMQLELGRSMSFYATLKLGETAALRRRALSQAKVQLNQSVRFVGQQCIQLHGGIGVTDEYSASHDFKRLTMIEMAWGDTPHHLAQVSQRMQDTAGVFA